MRAASQLPGRLRDGGGGGGGGALMWILPLYLHVNQNPMMMDDD